MVESGVVGCLIFTLCLKHGGGGGRGLQKQKLTRQTIRQIVTNKLVWKMKINLRILMLKVYV